MVDHHISKSGQRRSVTIQQRVLRFCMACALASDCLALPEGGRVTAGSATLIKPNGQQLTIQQNSERVAIEYDSFNIGTAELVNFIQPGRDSVALNRVLGPNASQIMGQLQSNGQVFLINPNGILFAPGAQVDVGGLIATTLDITDQDFMKGEYRFQNQSGSSASVNNQGELNASPQGYVLLIANTVNNSGDIEALNGSVALVSTDSVLVNVAGSNIAIETDAASWNGLIENQGTIQADGGKVLLQANTAQQLYNTVVENTGLIQANRFQEREGEIWLVGGEQGDVWQSGNLDVSATESNPGRAGVIEIQGQRVAHSGTSLANGVLNTSVSSNSAVNSDGGSIQITADETVVLNEEARLSADAGIAGDGGKIKVFSPDIAIFRDGANISATGGALSGDGGFVDVSGWQQVEADGRVDVSASNGNTGTYLIDPFNITIDAANVGGSFDGGVPTNTWTPSATGSTVDSATITANLSSANVIIQTAGGGAEAGDITVNSAINLDGSNGNQLSLVADGAILINADIADQDTATIDNTNLVFTASGDFTVTPGNTLNAGAGTIAITSSADVNVSGLQTTNGTASAVDIIANAAINGNGVGVDISAPNGSIGLNAVGGVGGIDIQASGVTLAGGGDVTLTETDNLNLTVTGAFDNVDLTSGGDLTIADGGITTTTSLTLDVADVVDSDRTVVLNAPTLTLTSALASGDSNINTTATSADITTTGGNLVSLNKTDAGNLTVTGLTVNGGFESTLANGNLTLPVAVTVPGLLSVSANDVSVSTIDSQDLLLDLSGGAGDLTLTTTVNQADINLVGRSLVLNETDGLVLADLNGDGSSLSTTNSNLTVAIASGDLTVDADITASDALADGTRQGLIDVSVNGGSITVGAGSAVQIVPTNTVDQAVAGGLGTQPTNQTAIRIQQLDATDQTNDFVFGDGTGNDVVIQAEGGDIFIDALSSVSLSDTNSRNIVLNNDVSVNAFNNLDDPSDGTSTLNNVTDNGNVIARTGREILLIGQSEIVETGDVDQNVAENSPGVFDSTNDVLDIPGASVVENSEAIANNASTPFDQLFKAVFGDCTVDSYRSNRYCKVDSAVKRFLGSLLIGGDLPD